MALHVARDSHGVFSKRNPQDPLCDSLGTSRIRGDLASNMACMQTWTRNSSAWIHDTSGMLEAMHMQFNHVRCATAHTCPCHCTATYHQQVTYLKIAVALKKVVSQSFIYRVYRSTAAN